MPGADEASPFAGAARDYARFRPPYAPAAFEYISRTYRLTDAARVLDLGCGPGAVAIPLSVRVGEVVAVDPDAEMLAEGRRMAEARGRRNLGWLQARAEDVPLDLGPFRVATLGQSFHWMDRDRVLSKLARLVEVGGGLALINPGRRRPQESWEPLARQVVETHLGARARDPRSNPQEPQNEPALRRSEAFHTFTSREFPVRITRDVSSIIGCVFSMSGSTRQRFLRVAEAFEAELSAALLEMNPSGVFHERLETEVVIARRRP